MSPHEIIVWAALIAEIILAIALVMTTLRIIIGPTLADRVVGLDMLVAIAIGLIAVLALRTDFAHALDIAMALSVAGFLATLALARYILTRGREAPTGQGKTSAPAKTSAKTGRRKS